MNRAVLITSTYNGEKYLPQMLDSILEQTYKCITLFVRDDGSKDSSVEILRSYKERFKDASPDMELVILNESDGVWENKGSHESYRYLMSKMPDAPYYLFCDQDDVWHPEKTRRAVERMEEYPEDVPVLYVHNYHVCDENLNIEHDLPPRDSVSPDEMKNINLARVIMTGTWGGVGMSQGFNKKLKELAFDKGYITPSVAVDCWISWVVAGAEGALCYDEMPLAYYRRHPGTFSSGDANGLLRYKDWFRHMDRHVANIVNGLRDYKRLYGNDVSTERAAFLELFNSSKRFEKLIYPHRLRNSLGEELAFRLLILSGKI